MEERERREKRLKLPVDVRNVNLFCCAAVRQTKSRARDVSNCGAH